jgi:hypothetical protein
MNRITSVKARPGYRLHLVFENGTEGEVDVSALVGRGVFAALADPGVFSSARVGSAGELVWSIGLDLCADALYLRITGQSPADVFPALKREARIA